MNDRFRVRIEAPTTDRISDVVVAVKGWIAGDTLPTEVALVVGSERLKVRLIARPDVERVFPDKQGIGFTSTIDFRIVPPHASQTSVFIVADNQKVKVCDLDVDAVSNNRARWSELKRKKLTRILPLLACPVCRSYLPEPAGGPFYCPKCDTEYQRSETSIDLLPRHLREEFRLIDTENVSAHPYAREAREVFDAVSARGGLTLDMGAGDQRNVDPSVICAEIVAYPATDVLAVGQRLPFRDASFDAVYSNAALEHVTDPFTCSDELMRVLKPGGIVFCSVPFLQPEHGYPHHYYNMTQDGLVNLFTRLGATLTSRNVPDWGHPLYAGQWFLSSYLQYLPKTDRLKLENMPIKEFLRLRRSQAEPLFANLSEEGRRVLACATYATFQKPD